jgi:hypothetical protein
MKKQRLKLDQLNVSSFITKADLRGGVNGGTPALSDQVCFTTPVDNCRYDSNQYVCLSLPPNCGTIGEICGM